MGNLEERNRKRVKRENLQKVILYSVAAVGILGVALVAPNAIQAMDKLGILPNPRRREYITSSASKLAKRGLMKFEDGYYKLTEKGEKLLRKWELENFYLNKPKKWDKKWRMIIFDIQEKKRRVRKQISSIFGAAGFYRLQDSVWIYPYDCEDIIGLLKTDYGVGKEILFVIAEEIENDKYLRLHFDLIP